MNTIIKVEPIEDEEFIPEINIHTEPPEEVTELVPKISNPRTVSKRGKFISLKRQYSRPEPRKAKIPKIFQVTTDSANYSIMDVTLQKFKCQFCKDKFSCREEIMQHIQDKHNFKCPNCPASFEYKISLIQHQVSEHKDSSSPVVVTHFCPVCKVKFWTKEKLAVHMKQKHSMIMKCLDMDDEKTGKVSSVEVTFSNGKTNFFCGFFFRLQKTCRVEYERVLSQLADCWRLQISRRKVN